MSRTNITEKLKSKGAAKYLSDAGGKIKKAHITKAYARYRLEDPSHFQKGSFRTLDVGREGHTKVVIARPKGKTTTKAQAILVSRKDYAAGERVVSRRGRAVIVK